MFSRIASFFNLQRRIFGVCPECDEVFRLGDCTINAKAKTGKDWLDAINAEDERLVRLEEKIEEQRDRLKAAAARKGRMAAKRQIRKIDRVFTPNLLEPDDAKVIFHPIDFVVFNGLTDKDRKPMKNIVLLDRQTADPAHRALQKSIEQAVEKGRYEWQTLRVEPTGAIVADK